jgi:hypothetical protein
LSSTCIAAELSLVSPTRDIRCGHVVSRHDQQRRCSLVISEGSGLCVAGFSSCRGDVFFRGPDSRDTGTGIRGVATQTSHALIATDLTPPQGRGPVWPKFKIDLTIFAVLKGIFSGVATTALVNNFTQQVSDKIFDNSLLRHLTTCHRLKIKKCGPYHRLGGN